MTDEIAKLSPENNMLPVTAQGANQARAIAEVQAAIVVAKAHPRDEMFCHTQIMKSCERKSLAEKAVYAYKRGSTLVTGPSIALAETIARHWGNINYGFREISRDSGSSEVESFAHDVQTNTRVSRTFTVKHWRDTKSGGYALKEERDIYEIVANMAQRRVRACLLEIVPRDIVDDAEMACNKTITSDGKPMDQQIKDMLIAFDSFGITQENIEEMLQRSVKSIIPADIVKLKQVYTSINTGVARREDFFDLTPKAGDKLNEMIGIKPVKDKIAADFQENLKEELSKEKEEPVIEESIAGDGTVEDPLDVIAVEVMTSDHPDHPFNRTRWIACRAASTLEKLVKDDAESWLTTTKETQVEFFEKWKRILKSSAMEVWPFDDPTAPAQKDEDSNGDQDRSAEAYINIFKGCESVAKLEEWFKANSDGIMKHPERDIIIAEYDRLLDANEDAKELVTAQDFLKHIYHAENTSELSMVGMKYGETIDALPESEEIWNRLNEKTTELNSK